jgi:hypothetical protein
MENKLILLNEPINLGNQLFLASFSFPNLTEFGGKSAAPRNILASVRTNR